MVGYFSKYNNDSGNTKYSSIPQDNIGYNNSNRYHYEYNEKNNNDIECNYNNSSNMGNEEMKFSEEEEVLEFQDTKYQNSNDNSKNSGKRRQDPYELKHFPGQSRSGRIYLPQGY